MFVTALWVCLSVCHEMPLYYRSQSGSLLHVYFCVIHVFIGLDYTKIHFRNRDTKSINGLQDERLIVYLSSLISIESQTHYITP